MPMSELVGDQASGLRHMMRPSPVQVLAIASGKGGVGKTNVSVNLSVGLSGSGRQTMLFDADLGLANVDVLLGLQPRVNLSHVLDGSHALQDVIVSGPSGLKIVPASSGVAGMANLSTAEHAGVIQAFSDLTFALDTLVVDTAAGVSDDVVCFTRAAQEVIIVVCDEPASITDAYALVKVMSRSGDSLRFHVLSNMAANEQDGRALYHKLARVCQRFLNVNLHYLGTVPYDPALRKAVQLQQAVIEAFPASPSAKAFARIARIVDGWAAPTSSRGHLEFFVERLVHSGPACEGYVA